MLVVLLKNLNWTLKTSYLEFVTEEKSAGQFTYIYITLSGRKQYIFTLKTYNLLE